MNNTDKAVLIGVLAFLSPFLCLIQFIKRLLPLPTNMALLCLGLNSQY